MCLPVAASVRAGGTADSARDGGTANWSSAANWSTNPQIPNGDYNAFIGAGQVLLDANYGVMALSLGGGEITGTNPRTLTANGLFWWQNGTISGGMILRANGGIVFDSMGAPILDGSTLINVSNQPVNNNFSGLHLMLKNGATFSNPGVLEAQNSLVISDGGGAGSTVNNPGLLTINVQWFTSSIGVPFNNSGTVQIKGGNLQILNGSSSTGNYDIDGTGQLELSGGAHVLHPGTSFTGFGTAAFAGGTLQFNGNVGTGTGYFSIGGGTVNTTGSLTVGHLGFFGPAGSPPARITAGTFIANEGVRIFRNPAFPPGPIVSLGGTTLVRNKGVDGKFSNSGTGFVLGSGSAIFQNEVGAVFEMSFVDSPAAFSVESGNPLFNNAGTVRCDLFGLDRTFGIYWQFNNSGTVTAQSGTLLLNGGGLSTGIFDLSGGNIIFGGGTHVFNSGTILTSSGVPGYAVLTGGTLKFGGAVGTGTGDFFLSGGMGRWPSSEKSRRSDQ